MRNVFIGGLCGVLCGAALLAACGSGAGAALTQADLDAQLAVLRQQIEDLEATLAAHEAATAPHHPSTPKLGLRYCIALEGQYPSRTLTLPEPDGGGGTALAVSPMIGGIALFAGNFPPRGWAFCEGQVLDIAEHDALFSLLGVTYGGDGRDTFALPDLRGRVAMGVDSPAIGLGDQID